MDGQQTAWTRRTKDTYRSLKDRMRANSSLVAKVATTCFAIAIGVSFILVCVYSIIPGIITNSTRKLEQDIALELYDKTVEDTVVTVLPTDVHQVFEQPVAHAEQILSPRNSFASVLESNPDIVGRVSIPPDITYLVTQSSDNEYYLSHGYEKEQSKSGTIYLDYRCNANTSSLSGHYILYGHNMKNGSMFHDLMEYKEEAFFKKNRTFRFDTLFADYEWEIFSVYITDTDFYFIDTDFEDQTDWERFLGEIRAKSIYETHTRLNPDDVVLTLCTCTYEFDDARFVIHAKLIQ